MKRLLKWFGMGLGVLVLFVFVNVLWFVTGKPEVKVNYVKELNALVRPAGATEEQNAGALFIEATDLLIEPNDLLYYPTLQSTFTSKYHHQFLALSKGDQDTVNRWVEQYYETDTNYYQDLIEEAVFILPPQELVNILAEGEPECMTFLDRAFLRLYFPGYEIGMEYFGDYLFGFGWDMSTKIIDEGFDPRWNKAIAALLIKEWKKQIELEKREVPKWLESNEPAWRKLEEGCERDYFGIIMTKAARCRTQWGLTWGL